MSKEFFKEFVKKIKSEILYGIPNDTCVGIYHKIYEDGEYIQISCGANRYHHYSFGKEEWNFEGEEAGDEN